MRVYSVDFVGMYPVGNCLIIKANDFQEAVTIAKETLFTSEYTIKEVDLSESGVIIYLSGDY